MEGETGKGTEERGRGQKTRADGPRAGNPSETCGTVGPTRSCLPVADDCGAQAPLGASHQRSHRLEHLVIASWGIPDTIEVVVMMGHG